MSLALLGAGLVSPIAASALQHALFVEAGVGRNPPTAFWSANDEPIFVHHTPWLGARMPVAERMVALAAAAARVALALCAGETDGRPTDAELEVVAQGLARHLGMRPRLRARGAASAFGALAAGTPWLEAGEADAVLVVAVDSMVSLDVARAEARRAPPWLLESPSPSEAAAAVLVVGGQHTRARDALGTLHAAAVLRGDGCDLDDVSVDGSAMTTLLEQARGARAVRVYGQSRVDDLRREEWTYAAARSVDALHSELVDHCVEAFVGRLGAAAGLAQVAYAAARERALGIEPLRPGPVLCWAISADGTRGLVRLEPAARHAPVSEELAEAVRVGGAT